MDILAKTGVTPAISPALRNKRLVFGLMIFGLLLFFVMWFSYSTESLFYVWDQPINAYFSQFRENAPSWLTSAARAFGKAGSQGVTVATIILLIVWALRRQFRYFWLVFAAVAGVELLWLGVVFAIGRPRPVHVETVGGIVLPSFPSGHVMLYVGFFGALLYLFYMRFRSRSRRLVLAVALVALLLLTGFVRLYFTAHYFTDVIAGYGLGFAWTAGVLLAVEWVFRRRQHKAVYGDDATETRAAPKERTSG